MGLLLKLRFGVLLMNVSSPYRQDLADLMDAFDTNQDGRISYEEFCRALEAGSTSARPRRPLETPRSYGPPAASRPLRC